MSGGGQRGRGLKGYVFWDSVGLPRAKPRASVFGVSCHCQGRVSFSLLLPPLRATDGSLNFVKGMWVAIIEIFKLFPDQLSPVKDIASRP